MFSINASARENFDSKAELLLGHIVSAPREETKKEKFESDIHIAATITAKDIIGELREGISDYRGNKVGRFFIFGEKRYGLIGENHEQLVKLAESLQKLPTFRYSVSKDFIEEIIFLWLRNKFENSATHQKFTQFLESEASSAVKPTTVFVPIANTVVEATFHFCGAIVRNMTKAMIDDLASMGDQLPDENRKNAAIFFEDFRQQYQGYAVVEIKLTCEPNYADDLAIEMATKITDLLGIYSGAVLIPDVKCISKMKGTENLAKYTTMTVAQNGELSLHQGILDRASIRNWAISKLDLEKYCQCGLGVISDIANKENRTEFEETVLNMAFLYSKAAFTSDPMEKLVHVLSAVESTLLKNQSEPIQQNLAERLALFTSPELSERKAIIKNIRRVYGLRSKYLHHGHSSSDIVELSKFFTHVWIFYVKLVINSGRFKTKLDFLEEIDDRKLA